MVRIKLLTSIVEILDGTNISEIGISNYSTSVRLKRNPEKRIKDRGILSAEATEYIDESEKTENIKNVEIKSETVGIFYRGKSRGASPKIKAGKTVKKGDSLGYVECVGVLHSVEAPCDGKISKVLVSNHFPVEYGQVLFELENE